MSGGTRAPDAGGRVGAVYIRSGRWSQRSFNRDDGICIAEFKSIVDQIVHNLINFCGICFDIQFVSGQDQVKGKALFFTASLKHQYCSFDELIQIKYGQIQVRAFRTIFIQFQKTLRQLFQTFCFKNDNV